MRNQQSKYSKNAFYYLLAESDGKLQCSKDSRSGSHGDARQTHNECLGPSLEPPQPVRYCGQTKFIHYGHCPDNNAEQVKGKFKYLQSGP